MRNTAQSTANDGFYYQVTDSPVPGIASAANASLPQVFQSVPDSSAAASSGAQSAVQIVGNQTLYKRGKIWVAENATDIDIDQNADRIQVVARFSEQYFQLISDNTPSENALMATQRDGEELLVLLRGKHYRIQ
jgi:hypothetical protein